MAPPHHRDDLLLGDELGPQTERGVRAVGEAEIGGTAAECDLFACHVLPHIEHGPLVFEPDPVVV